MRQLQYLPGFAKLCIASVLGVALASGCATTSSDGEEAFAYTPMPMAEEVPLEDLEPIERRSITDLLESALVSLHAANAAQEQGANVDALGHYTAMLELLIEADVDPAVFYSLRTDYQRILDTTTLHARAFERDPSLTWTEEATVLAARSDLEYPFPLPDRVLAEIEEIQTRYPEAFARGLSRSSKYLPYIQEEFKKAGLPDDLVWLAMVESQFTPKIKSRAGAGGMWQFMRSTGRHYGLRIDGTLDERFDWQKSTQSAIKYLSNLHDMFDGSWPLAVSAYNMGESGLSRAIASNGGERNLWRLIETPPAANRIRRETKKFYPKLLATAIVAKDPEKYGIFPESYAPDSTVLAEVDGAYLLRDLEREANLEDGILRRLNPHLIREMTPLNKTYQIVVPEESEQVVLAAIKKTPKLRPDTHIVRRGETPSEIAGLHGVSVRELMRVNNIRSARSLQINQRLVIPGRMQRDSGAVASEGRQVYTVKRGDSLSRIARRHGVRIRDLQAWNSLGGSTRIHIGDRIYVSPRMTIVAANGSYGTHVVRSGEFPMKIAKRYNMRLDDFLAVNGLTRTSTIHVGQKLRVAVPNAGPARPAPRTVQVASRPSGAPGSSVHLVHVVAPGDNATTIADHYGIRPEDFLVWNNLSRRHVLQIGDEYAVHVSPEMANTIAAEKAERAASSREGERIIHRVRYGQNPTLIARQYRVELSSLFEWNGWTKEPVLQVGNEVVVYTTKR